LIVQCSYYIKLERRWGSLCSPYRKTIIYCLHQMTIVNHFLWWMDIIMFQLRNMSHLIRIPIRRKNASYLYLVYIILILLTEHNTLSIYLSLKLTFKIPEECSSHNT